MGIAQAEHEETAPTADALVINRLACSLAGVTQTITPAPGSLVHQIYGQAEITEEFLCNFGLNPLYRAAFEASELRIVGTDIEGEARMVELSTHPFFVATLFLPQVRSSAEQPHPLITAYLQAAFRQAQRRLAER